jgi:hypothetical protein
MDTGLLLQIVAPQVCPQALKISPRHMYFYVEDDDASFTHIHRRGFPGPHPVLEPLPTTSFPFGYVFPDESELEAVVASRQSQMSANGPRLEEQSTPDGRPCIAGLVSTCEADTSPRGHLSPTQRSLPKDIPRPWVSKEPRQVQHDSTLGLWKPNGQGLSVPGRAFTPAPLQTTRDLAKDNLNYRSPHQQASDPKYTEASKKSNGLQDSDAIPGSKPHNGEDTNAEKKRGWSAPPEDARQHGVKHTKREGGVWRSAFRLFKPGTKSALQVVQE